MGHPLHHSAADPFPDPNRLIARKVKLISALLVTLFAGHAQHCVRCHHAPGILTADASGLWQGAILTLNSPDSPALAGAVVVL